MFSKPNALTIAFTGVCALTIGFFMQKSDLGMSSAAEMQNAAELDSQPFLLEDITYTSLESPQLLEAAGFDCSASMTAQAADNAMVHLHLSAPCDAGRVVTLHHIGLMFSQRLDQDGQLEVLVPAMAENAVFLAAIPKADAVMAQVQVPDVTGFHRVALQGPAEGVDLHAYEYGAQFGEAGHVWSHAPSGQGELLRLGDPSLSGAQSLQIYSHALADLISDGAIELSLEAEVRDTTCNRSLALNVLAAEAGQLQLREVSLEMPDCDAIGDFLVLNNPVESLKIARN